MKTFKGPDKGQTVGIEISSTQRDRVLIGLSWDMKDLDRWDLLPTFKKIPYVDQVAGWADDSIHA